MCCNSGENQFFYKEDLNNCNIVIVSEMSAMTINELMAANVGNCYCDIFVLTDDYKLMGMICTQDIARAGGGARAEELVNHDPITVIHSEKWEYKQVNCIFNNSPGIWTVPVVNLEGTLLYAYVRVHPYCRDFRKMNHEFADLKCYCKALNDFAREEMQRNGISDEIKIISDLPDYYDKTEVSSLLDYPVISDISLITINNGVILAFLYDYNCMKIIGELLKRKIKYVTFDFTKRDMVQYPIHYFMTDRIAQKVLEKEAKRNRTYFDLNDFENIIQAIKLTKELVGDYVEIGTYKGDSARVALSYMKETCVERKAWFLDTFEGFNYEEAKDSGDSLWACTVHDDTSEKYVESQLNEFGNYKLVRTNIIRDDLPEEIKKIVVCNIDVDIYEAVKESLEKVKKLIVPGGVILAEDYGHTPHLFGAEYAIKTFYEKNRDCFYGLYLQSGQFILIRKDI